MYFVPYYVYFVSTCALVLKCVQGTWVRRNVSKCDSLFLSAYMCIHSTCSMICCLQTVMNTRAPLCSYACQLVRFYRIFSEKNTIQLALMKV